MNNERILLEKIEQQVEKSKPFFLNDLFQFPYSAEARFFGTTHDDLVGMLSATRLFAGCLSGIVLLVSTTGKHYLVCNIVIY